MVPLVRSRAASLACVVLSVLFSRWLGGCGSDNFDPAWRVKSFRILAVLADPPDALPGDTVTLTAILADKPMPAGITRPVTVAWAVCAHLTVDPVSGSRGCGQGNATLLNGLRTPFVAPAPEGGNPYGIYGYACAGGTPGLDPVSHNPQCVGVGSDGVAFVRTLPVRGASPNHNPGIAQVSLDGVPLVDGVPGTAPLCVGDRTQCRAIPLTVQFTPDARERVPEVQADGSTVSLPESLVTEFLCDGGDLDGSFRSDGDADLGPRPNPSHGNTFTPPSEPGTVHLWVLVKDGRGGVSAALRTVRVGVGAGP